MWSFMKRWLCPIYNGFPENFIWSIMWKIASIFHGLEVFQSDLTSLCFSAVETCHSLLLKDYNHWWYLIHTWSDKAFRGTFVNQESMSEGSLNVPLIHYWVICIVGFPIKFSLRGIAHNGCCHLGHLIASNCAIIGKKEAIKYSRNCVQRNCFSI